MLTLDGVCNEIDFFRGEAFKPQGETYFGFRIL